MEIRQTFVFSTWLNDLKDRKGRNIILRRIDRLSIGNSGNVQPVGHGVSELKIDFGPGYRVYFVNRNHELIVLLCGGDKSSQQADIAIAQTMAKNLEA